MKPALLLHQVALLGALWMSTPACMAQRTPIAPVKPIPGDVTPRVQVGQCGGFTGHFGPMDFRMAYMEDRRIVEAHHFDQEFQTWLTGRVFGKLRTGTDVIGHGFVYTLKSFPNHPTALLVLEQLGRKLKSEQPQNIEFPLECFYVRAFQIAPDDPAVRAMYGVYLANRDRKTEALLNLDQADKGLRFSGPMQYQIALAYLTLKEYEKAQLCAMRAEKLGFPLETVIRGLRTAGKWNDALVLPAEPEAAEPAASAASGAG